MYSIENRLFRDGMSALDRAVHGPRFTGVGAQILGADDKYMCQFSEKSNNFWGSKIHLPNLLSSIYFPYIKKCSSLMSASVLQSFLVSEIKLTV
jgi:tocopherol cyclase